MTRICIGGDIVPTPSNFSLFESGDAGALVGRELQEKLVAADLAVFNLEVPLTDTESPIEKCGPNLIAPPSTITGLAKLSRFVGLANNHIMDQGEQGLFSTMRALDSAGIAHTGAGASLKEAATPYIFSNGDVAVGIYCCAEHEFSIAADSAPGANPFDPLESPDHVRALKEECDYVIVLYHGGKEHYRYPSPYLQKVCRKLVDKGAGLVVCQHSHCIGCEEEWHGGRIVYGQGNFLFDKSDSEFWNTSLLIEVAIERRGGEVCAKIEYTPLAKRKNTVRAAEQNRTEQNRTEQNRTDILAGFYSRSQEILEPGLVEQKYAEFAASMRDGYMRALGGRFLHSIPYRALNLLTGRRFSPWYISLKYGRKDRLRVQNFIECEAHWELLLKGVQNWKK